MSDVIRLPKAEDFCPALDGLEDAAESVKREVDRLMEAAREELRRRQDFTAELEDDGRCEGARIALHSSAHRLRSIARMFTVAQAGLVPPTDQRYAAARRVISYADEAQRADAPWKAA